MIIAQPADEQPEENLQSRVLKVLSGSEPRSPRDIELIKALQAKIVALQEGLAKAEREIRNYEQLLKNARQREKEILAQYSR